MPSDSSDQYQTADMPDYLQQGANRNLRRFQGQIGGLYDFAPIQAAGNAYIQSNFDQQRAGAAAMAAAAQHRAMQSGGAVGASFAQAGAMLPLYNQRNEQAFNLAQLHGQMNMSQADLRGRTAGMMDNNSLQRAGMMSQYGLGQQRLASDNEQFDQTFGLQQQRFGLEQQQFGLQQRQFNAQIQQRMQQPGNRPWYQTDSGGMPASSRDRQAQQRGDDWSARWAALQY